MSATKITKGTKAGEPRFRLELDHKDELMIRWELGYVSTYADIAVTNPFENFFAVKVKTTDTSIFRVRQPSIILAPKESFTFRIISHAQDQPQQTHYITFVHIKCTEMDASKDPNSVWIGRHPDGILRVPVHFMGRSEWQALKKSTTAQAPTMSEHTAKSGTGLKVAKAAPGKVLVSKEKV